MVRVQSEPHKSLNPWDSGFLHAFLSTLSCHVVVRASLWWYHDTVPRRALPAVFSCLEGGMPMDVLHAVRVTLYLLSRISVCGPDNVKYLNACFEELNRLRDSLQQETNPQEGA